MTSASRGSALAFLSHQGLTPVELQEQQSAAGDSRSRSARGRGAASVLAALKSRAAGIGSRELLTLTQSIAALLKAGLTIDRALQISAALAPLSASRTLVEKLLDAVRAGQTLGAALERSGQRLPPYYVSMVNAGEVGGSLPETLTRLGELLGKQMQIRERVRSALVYPTLLAGTVVFILVMLLAFVLPRFESLFAESETPLPIATRVVLGVGRFLADFWWAMALAAATVAGAFVVWLCTPAGRGAFDRWILKSRLTAGLPAALNTARLLRTVSTLCGNGLPLPAALRTARGTLVNRGLLEALDGMTRDVQAGRAFSVALAAAGVFPPVAVQLARVGEETGKLDEMLLSAAAVLEEQSQRRLERLLTLLVPLLTIAMGLIVAGLIGSVLIGLLSINDLAI